MNTRKIIKIGNSQGTTIPFEVRAALKLNPGDEIQFVITRAGLVRLYKYVRTGRYNKTAKPKRRNKRP